MYLLVFYLSLNSFLITSLFGRYLGYAGSNIITTSLTFISNIVSFIVFYEVVLNESYCEVNLFKWINTELLDVSFKLSFDSLTSLMLIVVNTISLCAHFYSISYMHGDPHQPRFMSYLSLFTWFMIVLITSSNFIQLFLGWEGVGICSFLLINFWFTRLQANKSAVKAMVTNKISDICLTVAMFLLFSQFKTLDFSLLFTSITRTNDLYYNIDIICFLIMLGAVGKSAQIILHVWLPDAMEGPTPVSSLIHAATMVTAGIFLVIRCSYIFEHSSTVLLIIIFFGSLTAFFSSITGFFQNDIKKVVAYSTCSQLGYMFFINGYSFYSISFFHLFNHAFFKALLFLAAGSLIHSINNEQDVRNMGGFVKLFPLQYMSILIGSLSLAGFPFTTGFYSKDTIIESSYNMPSSYFNLQVNFIHGLYWILVVSILFTSLYSLRVILLTFIEKFKGKIYTLRNIHHIDIFIMIPLALLCILSITIGFITKELLVGLGTPVWDSSIMNTQYIFDYEFYHPIYKSIPLIVSVYSSLVITIFYGMFYKTRQLMTLSQIIQSIITFLNQKWFFDKLYNDFISRTIYNSADFYYLRLFDKGILEFFGPYGITILSNKVITLLIKLQSGLVYHFIGLILNCICYLIVGYVVAVYI
uniref:NADH-ubiquinone oxidoreductase chain 5 n=1 Tax=Pharyngomonas kirbyi TaxID=63601 RepID=A0A1W6R283_9EUKA|nr:NADH dehydrogenase subunit 5 [Pharyngomonas kirbyi]ARO48004.1 NADH dehydrogenase subunit 5 [Pharyngomonas kirbyi]